MFTANPTFGPSPLTVDFDASASYDLDGEIVAYSWDFNDGTSGAGVTTSHVFSTTTDKTYTVTLTVRDDGGKTATTSATISVTGSPSGTVLFSDDFQEQIEPDWASTSSLWKVKEGKYEFHPNDPWSRRQTGHAFVLTGQEWSDYGVEADVWHRSGHVGVILRAQVDLKSMVIAWGSTEAIWWEVIQDGESTVVSDSVTPGLFVDSPQHIRIEVSGSTYRFFVRGILRSTFEDAHFQFGMPGVAASNFYVFGENRSVAFDNFEVKTN